LIHEGASRIFTLGILTSFFVALFTIKRIASSEKELRESEAKFKRIADNSPAVLYQLMMTSDGAFSFPYVSDLVMTIMGIPPEDVMKDPAKLLGMVHPEDQEMFRESIMKSAESLESFPLTFRCMKDGEVIWIEARGMPTPLVDGGMLWDGFLLDVTERKQMEEERKILILKLQETLKEVKQLSGLLPICSHCKQIRDDNGYWNQIEGYISANSEAFFSHSICPDCAKKLYPEFDLYPEKNEG